MFYQAKKYDNAKRTLQPLLTRQPSNIWLVDLMTDIDLALKQTGQAISRLEALVRGNEHDANPVLLLNLANAYVEGHRYSDAIRILNRYTFSHPDDTNGWNLLAQAYAGQGLGDQELAARAERLALTGQLDQAVRALSEASSRVKLGSLQQARYDARIDQIRQLQLRFAQYEKSARR